MISRTFARTVTNSFRTSVPKGCANPGLLRSSTFQSSLFRSSQIQNTISQKRTISFKRIEVSSTLGVRLLRLSKTLGLAILVVYAIGGSAFTFLYVKETTKSDSAQKIPDDWPFKLKSMVRDAVNKEIDNKYEQALRVYKLAIDEMTTIEDPKTGERILADDLDKKTPEWLGGYSDVLIRYARLLELSERSDEALSALKASEQIPWGTPDLKSAGAVQLAKYAFQDGDIKLAEEYFLSAVKAVALPSMAKYFKEGPAQDLRKAVIIPDISQEPKSSILPTASPYDSVSNQLYTASIELGKFYASTGQYSHSLEVFLSTLRAVRGKHETAGRVKTADKECFEARCMSYISEVFWAADKNNKADAITWAEGAYNEASKMSNTTVECGLCAIMALENLRKMYKSVGMPEEAERCVERLDEIHPPLTNFGN